MNNMFEQLEQFQAELLDKLENNLTEEELDIVRRGRNIPVTTSKRINHKTHRIATAFEALLGWLYLNNKNSQLNNFS